MECFLLSAEQRDLVRSGTLMAFKCKTFSDKSYPLLDVRDDYSTFVQHVAMWGTTLGAYRFRLFLTRLKQKQTRLWLGQKENFTWYLISSSLFPVKGESEVYYVDLALHILVPVVPVMRFIISIPVK